MKVMIFAAGLGTRLKPLTDTLPKALVPLCGKPLIEHVTRKLQASGLNDIVVNVHHFADDIEKWIAEQDWLQVKVSDERKMLLETGGAVLHARHLLEDDDILIHNVDIISDLDLRWFMSEHREDAFATLLVSERPSSRYLLFEPDSMRLVGWTNIKTGQMRLAGPWVDPEKCRRLAFSGIHILSKHVLDVMETYAMTHGLYIASDTPRFPIMDFYLDMCSVRTIYGVEAKDLRLVDVGKLDSLDLAEQYMREI